MITMFTILHISDLHRSRDEPVDNDSLVAALVADRDRYSGETPVVPAPNASCTLKVELPGFLPHKDCTLGVRHEMAKVHNSQLPLFNCQLSTVN